MRSGSSVETFRLLARSPVYNLLFWSFFLCGFPPLPSATAYGLLSAVNLGGMILADYLSDRIDKVALLASIYALRAGTFVVLIMLPDLDIEWLFAFAVMFGVVNYSTVPVTAGLVASDLGVKVMGVAMGII